MKGSIRNVAAHAAAWMAGAALVQIALAAGLSFFGVLGPQTGFGLFALGVLGALIALSAGLALIPLTRLGSRTGGQAQAWGAAVTGALVLGALLLLQRGVITKPPIHDLTTSPQRAPSFLAAAEEPGNEGRDLAYPEGGPAVPAAQARAYPELQPIRIEAPPQATFERALAVSRLLGWRTLAHDRGRLRFEATATSRIFRFNDDVAVEIEGDQQGGSVVHVRSRSRFGRSDLGQNAARIARFERELRALS